MKKKKQPPSLSLGIAAFGSYALIMATVPEFAIPAIVSALIVAVAAGAAQAHMGRFFTGIALAFGAWVCLGMIFGSATDRSSALVLAPLVLAMTIGLGAASFLFGRLIARISKALVTRRIRTK